MPVSPHEALERKHAAMRALGEKIAYYREQERRLRPPHDMVGAGGADFDWLLKAAVGEAYLRALRLGIAPSCAHRVAADEGAQCVRVWNERTCRTRASVSGHYELQRWVGAGEAEADDVHRFFMRSI